VSVNLITRDEYPLSENLIGNLDQFFISILSSESIEDSNINLSFISSEEMQELNKQFRGIDKDTNVLSFENQDISREHTKVLGDIAICYPYVVNEATVSEKDLDSHISHMFIHGILHILGYDHENESEADNMESKEIEFLSKFNIINPYTL
jgi:probable rRNA maturation factor|tara:strand:+ start:7591 stop:8043 length:453 start_codon:yes stop_codon:yes gene_type:complete